jgi:hypothetical protein
MLKKKKRMTRISQLSPHVKIKRRLTEYFLKLTPKLMLNDALTEFHEENFMRLRYFQEFVKMR